MGPYDCVISTGNSVPHVDNHGFKELCESVSNCLRNNGYFYFDIRNWDGITRNKQRFFPFKLETVGQRHRVYLQVWDHNSDGSMNFNLVFIDYDEEGNPIRKETHNVSPYYPLLRKKIEEVLSKTGFTVLKYFDYGVFKDHENGEFVDDIEIDSEDAFMETDWYAVLAQKK